MAKRAKTFLAKVKKGDFGVLDKGNKKSLGTKYQYQQELEDFSDEDREKPKNHKNHN